MGKAFMHRTFLIKGDLYQTHYSLTWQLLKREKFPYEIHEPCCGKLAIVNAIELLKHHYCTVTYSDLFYSEDRIDFLKDNTKRDSIITNPPYGSITDYFIMHAKKVYKYKIAMLLRTNYLSGYQRFRKNVYKELKQIWVFTRMCDLRAEIRQDGKYPTAGIVYAWFIWEKNYNGPVIIDWIDNQKYVLNKENK